MCLSKRCYQEGLNRHLVIISVCSVFMLTFSAAVTHAILLDVQQETFDPNDTTPIALAEMLPESLRPAEEYAVRLGGQISGIAIGDNYVVTAGHWKLGSTATQQQLDAAWGGTTLQFVGFDSYIGSGFQVVDQRDSRWFTGINGETVQDLVVLKVEDPNDPTRKLPAFAPISSEPLRGSDVLTHGSYGPQQKRVIDSQTILGRGPILSNVHQLVWGRKRVIPTSFQNYVLESNNTVAVTLPDALVAGDEIDVRRLTSGISGRYVDPGSDAYLTHQADELNGDSGSGIFTQNVVGEWGVAASTQIFAGAIENFMDTRVQDWLDDAVIDMGGNGITRQAFDAGLDHDTRWVGSGSSDWFVSQNWSSGAVPTNATSVVVDGPAVYDVVLSQPSTANAKALFLGIDSPGSIRQDTGTLSVEYSVVIGVSSDSTYEMFGGSLNGGQLTVGGGAAGSVDQDGGNVAFDHSVVIGDNTSGISSYTIEGVNGSSSLSTQTIAIATSPSSLASLAVAADASVHAVAMEVGQSGTGVLAMTNGSTQISESMVLGVEPGSLGQVAMAGGLLKAAEIVVGADGSGILNQTGGAIGTITDPIGTIFVNDLGRVSLNGGTMTTEIFGVDKDGTLDMTGGTLVSEQAVINGNLDFHAGSHTYTTTGITYINNATIQNQQNAQLAVGPNSLLFASAPIVSLGFASTSVDPTSAVVIGSDDIVLDSSAHQVQVAGQLFRPVVIDNGASLSAKTGKGLDLEAGLTLVDGQVDLGTGRLTVPSGSTSTVTTGTSVMTADTVFVRSGATLVAEGHLSLTGRLNVTSGTFEVGTGFGSVLVDGVPDTVALVLQDSTTVKFDIGGTSAGTHDHIAVDGDAFFLISPSQTLTADLNLSYSPALYTDKIALLEADSFLVFEVSTGFTHVAGVEQNGFSLAVTYEDVDGDGTEDTVFVTPVLPGDANLDMSVDLADFNLLAANFGITDTANWVDGDFNGDGDITLDDFDILGANFGLTYSPPSGVPEPSSLLLLGVAALCVTKRRYPSDFSGVRWH